MNIGDVLNTRILHNDRDNHDKVYAVITMLTGFKENPSNTRWSNKKYIATMETFAVWGRRGAKTYQVQQKKSDNVYTDDINDLDKYNRYRFWDAESIINEKTRKGYHEVLEKDPVFKQVHDDMRAHLIVNFQLNRL